MPVPCRKAAQLVELAWRFATRRCVSGLTAALPYRGARALVSLLRWLGVSAWTGEAEYQVLQHASGPRRVLGIGCRPGAAVRFGLDQPSAPAAGVGLVRQLRGAAGRAV